MTDTNHSSYSDEEEIEIDLRHILKVLKKWSKLIIATTLLAALAAGLMSTYVLQPVYQAKTLLMVTVASEKLQTTINPQLNQNQDSEVSPLTPMPVLTMNTYLGQLKSEATMKRALDNLKIPGQTIGGLSSLVEASIVKDSNLIELKVKHTDPVLAAAIANTVSNEYLELMKEFMFSSVVVISSANVPTSPVEPNKQMNIAIAFILGLMLSTLLAFLLEYLDNTLKTPEDISRELDAPVLGIIPFKSDHNTRQSRYGGN